MIAINKLYVPVATLSINDNIKFFKNIKQGFKRKFPRNQRRSEVITQRKNNNLDYLIDHTFRSINRLYNLSFKNGDDDPAKSYFDEYYMPLIEIKDFDELIDNKSFFDQPVKKNKRRMKNQFKFQEIMIIGNFQGILLNYLDHQKIKIIIIGLSRQKNTNISQKVNFL